MRANSKVLRKVIGQGRGNREGGPCGYFEKGGEGVTEKGELIGGLSGMGGSGHPWAIQL